VGRIAWARIAPDARHQGHGEVQAARAGGRITRVCLPDGLLLLGRLHALRFRRAENQGRRPCC